MSSPRLKRLVLKPVIALALSPLLITAACFDTDPKVDLPEVKPFKFDPPDINIPELDLGKFNIKTTDPRLKSKDPVERRAARMELTTDELYSVLSLRYKIIQSRALVLYLTDILPAKGSPYKHMADFAAKTTKEAFKAAQKNNSKYMNTDEFGYWLPLEKGQKVASKDLADQDTAAIYKYFAQYAATAILLQDTIQPAIKESIVVESIEESSGASVKKKFDKAWGHIENIVKNYSELFGKSELTKTMISDARPQVVTSMAATIAEGMKEYLETVSNTSNQNALKNFVDSIAALEKLNSKSLVKKKMTELFDKESEAYAKVTAALENVDLPESGSIDGSDDAFEAAMKLELGFDILKKLASEIQEKW